jgi:hypothetical protein
MKTLSQDEINDKIRSDIDFINSKKYKNSLTLYLSSHKETISNNKICNLLNLSPEQLKKEMSDILNKYRQVMGADVSSEDDGYKF